MHIKDIQNSSWIYITNVDKTKGYDFEQLSDATLKPKNQILVSKEVIYKPGPGTK